MRIDTHRQYDKAWAKLTRKQQLKILAALKLFMIDPHDPQLRVHHLKGDYFPQYSLSAGGDLRVHYLRVDADTIILMLTGTHSQLYG